MRFTDALSEIMVMVTYMSGKRSLFCEFTSPDLVVLPGGTDKDKSVKFYSCLLNGIVSTLTLSVLPS